MCTFLFAVQNGDFQMLIQFDFSYPCSVLQQDGKPIQWTCGKVEKTTNINSGQNGHNQSPHGDQVNLA